MSTIPDISPADSSYFQCLIVIIGWAVDLWCICITCEVSIMSYHIEITWDGHLEKV